MRFLYPELLWLLALLPLLAYLKGRQGPAPALLFSASHGMSFPAGDSRQLPHQGALLCQDWPGPKEHKGRIPEDYYFSADDLTADHNLLGMLAFFFACYGAGTPHMDDFYRKAFMERKAIAPHAFLSQLPQRMLTHSKGGALAVVGHVERAWGYSFYWQGVVIAYRIPFPKGFVDITPYLE